MASKFDNLQGFLEYIENKIKEREKAKKKRKLDLEQEKTMVKIMKRRWLTVMVIIIFLGLIVPFGAQFFPLPWEIHAEIWNSYTSIVLGIIATICSLLSIYMSFYSMQQTFESNNYTVEDMSSIRQEIQELAIQIAKTKQSIDDLANHSTGSFVSVPMQIGTFKPEEDIVRQNSSNTGICIDGCSEVNSTMKELK